MDAATKKVLKRALGTLAVASLVIIGALLLNAPSTVRVDFDIRCRSFVLPAAIRIDLNRLPTQIATAVFYGFDGEIVGTQLAVRSTEDPAAATPIPLTGKSYPLAPAALTPTPYLKVTPGGGLGVAGADFEAGVTLSATADGALTAEASAARAIRAWLQSNHAAFEAERYPVRALLAEAQLPGVETTLRAIGLPNGTKSRMDVTFAAGPREQPLLDSTVPLQSGADLTFRAALPMVLSRDGHELPSLERDRELDVVLSGAGEITGLSLVPAPKDTDAPSVRIVGWATTNSVRQGGAELLPTWIEEVLGTSGLGRSVSITLLALAAFMLFKAVNGALDALLKVWIGD